MKVEECCVDRMHKQGQNKQSKSSQHHIIMSLITCDTMLRSLSQLLSKCQLMCSHSIRREVFQRTKGLLDQTQREETFSMKQTEFTVIRARARARASIRGGNCGGRWMTTWSSRDNSTLCFRSMVVGYGGDTFPTDRTPSTPLQR